MVANKAIYDLMVVPSEVKKDLDVEALCKLLNISVEDYEAAFTKASKYSAYKPSILVSQIPSEEFGKIADQLFQRERQGIQPSRLSDTFVFIRGSHPPPVAYT